MHKRLMMLIMCVVILVLFTKSAIANNSLSQESYISKKSEEIAIDPTQENIGYSVIIYDNTNGLPTSEANAICQSSDGFIWIGSYVGLIRYDGNTFERINQNIFNVMSLYVDSKDRLWIGTNDSGIFVMEKGNFKNFNKDDGLKSLSVRYIAEDSDGNIYFATTSGIAMIDENMQLSIPSHESIDNTSVIMLQKGTDGIVYGLTNNEVIFTVKNGKIDIYFIEVLSDYFTSILPDFNNPGYVYVGSSSSEIYHFELGNYSDYPEIISIDSLQKTNCIKQFKDQLWLCCDNGIGILENGKLINLENIPMVTSFESVMVDYQGNLWFSSSDKGILKVVPNQFTDIFSKYSGISETIVTCTCVYDEKLLIGLKDFGLISIGESGTNYTFPIKKATYFSTEYDDEIKEIDDLIWLLRSCKIKSIILDSKDRLWICSYGDYPLIRYENGIATIFSMYEGLPSNKVRTILELHDNTFAVVCDNGIVLLDEEKITYLNEITHSNLDIKMKPLTISESDNNELIVGTDGDGIYVISETETKHLGIESGLNSEVILRIKKDSKRHLFWIITSNSIAYMTYDYKITIIKNFPYFNNFDLFENNNSQMWILSSNGVYVVPVQDLLSDEEIKPTFYGMKNGLFQIPTANSYSELTDEGILYIAGTTGVAKININKPFDINTSDLKVSIPYVEADGKIIYADETGTITVPANAKKVKIYSHVFTYGLQSPEVTYYLEGFDDTKTTVNRSELVPVTYTNLKGGEYRFVITLDDKPTEFSVLIYKEKKIYELWWFKFVYVLLVIVLILIISKIYIYHKTKNILKKEQENKILVRGIVEAFAKTIDMKDNYTNGHSFRVAEYTATLAQELGYNKETIEKYYNIALLHDIGKIGVPQEVLNKPGKLTDDEFKVIKSHTELGYEALKHIGIMPELSIGAESHHERPDGKGYPKGLSGDQIPRVAQIIAVADTFDAMYSNRPYRKRMNFEKAVSIIKEVSGTQLASDVVDAFLRLVKKGYFRAADDNGGGTTEDINNIRNN